MRLRFGLWILVCLSAHIGVPRSLSAQTTTEPSPPVVASNEPFVVAALITASEKPLSAPATALARDKKRMAIGLPDGGVVVTDVGGKSGLAVRLPSPSAPTTRVVLSDDAATWQTGTTLCRFTFKDRVVTQRSATSEDDALFAPTVSLPDTSSITERTLHELRAADGYVVSTRFKANMSGGTGPFSASGDSIWWATEQMIFRHDRIQNTTEAYLPWSGAGGVVRALLAEGRGIWAATPRGVRHFYPMDYAFDGYVRAKLDAREENILPDDTRRSRMAAMIEEWQGVPYVWGGTTMAGCDCSGYIGRLFAAVGVTTPRVSGDIGKSGVEVEGDLRWGDVICLPGHVALYIGNGRTTEAMGTRAKGGAVGKATIWRRQNAHVRRFLP